MAITEIIDELVARAARERASDIHLVPEADRLRVRLRIDGLLQEEPSLPMSLHPEAIARLKIMAGLRTDEHQAAQDGRFRTTGAGIGTIDVRVAIAPTHHGENAVLRLLPEKPDEFDLGALGVSATDRGLIERAAGKSHGLILATGPTGSGKTTTLYALTALRNSASTAVTTIEDPVEYAIGGVTQIPVNARSGLTFATGLRAVLRQDPDVIMVGEVRDAETAGLAAGAALTGHLVLTTLHTNDAVTALPRLLDLKVEPYLIATAVSLVIGQRLVRRICAECREPVEPSAAERERLAELAATGVPNAFFRGRGCDKCRGTGYRGRVGLYEVLALGDDLRDAILRKAPASDLRLLAELEGLTPMLTDGLTKVEGGVTTVEEILRTLS
jgi:type II secretory ATPase GspE/PulE/Tfp pilus assembly ATPase PilB-like protein